MKRLLFLFLISLIISTSLLGTAKIITIKEQAKIYEDFNKNSSIILEANLGTELTAICARGMWVKVLNPKNAESIYANEFGYIKKNDIKIVSGILNPECTELKNSPEDFINNDTLTISISKFLAENYKYSEVKTYTAVPGIAIGILISALGSYISVTAEEEGDRNIGIGISVGGAIVTVVSCFPNKKHIVLEPKWEDTQ